MSPDKFEFLPGVPAKLMLKRLNQAAGNEIGSGKLLSPESSAALAVNTFGWFVERRDRLPGFPMFLQPNWHVTLVEIEYCARFPWSGGRHPWLDAWIETPDAIVGVESKRFEPFRDRESATFSDAYDRPVWHDRMVPYERLRDRLRSCDEHFECLRAVQLVKHAFGMVTEGRRKAKQPYLLYLFAEPAERAGEPICDKVRRKHRDEIGRFASEVKEAEVTFGAISYREWLGTWPTSDQALVAHRDAILQRFNP